MNLARLAKPEITEKKWLYLRINLGVDFLLPQIHGMQS